MAFKFFVVFALVSAATAAHLPVGPVSIQDSYAAAVPAYYQQSFPIAVQNPAYVKTVAAAPTIVKSIEYEVPIDYDFSYETRDPLSGDQKSLIESRPVSDVHGCYSLIDSDGFKRTVEYNADGRNGFNAGIHREQLVQTVSAPVTKLVTPVASVVQYAPVSEVVAATVPVKYAANPVSDVVSTGGNVEYHASPVTYADTPSYELTAPSLAPAYYAQAAAVGSDGILGSSITKGGYELLKG